jgi:hypothetical protein
MCYKYIKRQPLLAKKALSQTTNCSKLILEMNVLTNVGWIERKRNPPFLMNEKNEKVGFVPLPTLCLLIQTKGAWDASYARY